ncbi:hypothetical protein QTH90_13635 [Variovorax sp. J2P1-59]|uniref:hypothetical protein n=1 Tax=Variovorax flavidus TaxID=3053501 RepID=UPI0025780052|nr:hypothetical protein [Variovorax sp. J2P1-59]MDM0075437.1 hypothetical protein [Variovorax sp. J2P1-59]
MDSAAWGASEVCGASGARSSDATTCGCSCGCSTGTGATACASGRGSCGGAIGSIFCSTTGATATGASCNPGACQWIAAASRGGATLRSTVRFQYQKTNAAISRKTTISNSTTGTSRPPGRTGLLAGSRFSVLRDTTNRSFAIAAGMRAGAIIGTGIATRGTRETR